MCPQNVPILTILGHLQIGGVQLRLSSLTYPATNTGANSIGPLVAASGTVATSGTGKLNTGSLIAASSSGGSSITFISSVEDYVVLLEGRKMPVLEGTTMTKLSFEASFDGYVPPVEFPGPRASKWAFH